jgi:hypothetical protein
VIFATFSVTKFQFGTFLARFLRFGDIKTYLEKKNHDFISIWDVFIAKEQFHAQN